MDDSSIQKTWERPWSTEEMRAHCSNWNLAGDAGLLKHLQDFSQNLLQKTHTTEVALDSLLEDMRNTSVDVQNATNALLMLSNNQFVENRVYDDCEEEKDEMEVKPEVDKSSDVGEATLIAKAAEAILLGMSVIDTKFDCMEVPASDSEGEEDLESPGREGRDKKSFALVLEPRNPYTSRPLPFLIGSKEFMEDDRIGLGDEEDEEEEEEEEEEEMQVSMGQDLVAQGLANDSGSSLAADIAEEGLFDEDEVNERRMPKVPTKQNWESSSSNASDDVEVENNRIRKKQKKSDPFDGSREQIGPFGRDDEDEDIFGKGSSSEDEFFGRSHIDAIPSVPVKKTPVQKDFAEELAAKLGAVEDKKTDRVTAKPKKTKVESKAESMPVPKQKSKTPSISSDNLFGPPKDDWNGDDDVDSFFADPDGMFSDGRGLFDDLNDPLLDPKPSKFTSSAVPPSLSDKPPPFKKEKEPSLFRGNNNNLFGEEDEDTGDMFADILAKTKHPDNTKKSEQKIIKEETQKKKPAAASNVTPISSEFEPKGKTFVDSSDSWLFGEDDQEDLLYKEPVIPKERSKRQVEEGIEGKKDDFLHDTAQQGEKKDVAPAKKLPAGARSFYAGGVDPFALGKKIAKEAQDKKKGVADDEVEDDLFSGPKPTTKKVTTKAAPKPAKSEPSEKESRKEPKPSPKPDSLFDDLDDRDDLFAPVTSITSKSKDFQNNDTDGLFGNDLFVPKKSAPAASDKFGEKEKISNAKKGGLGVEDPNSKGLFGDSASDDDDIFSCSSSLGSRSSASKIVPSKSTKPFSDPSSSLFGGNYNQEADIFSGALGKTSASEKKDVDDLFKGIIEDDSQSGLSQKKEVLSSEIKNKVPPAESVKSKEDELFSEALSGQKIRGVSEDLFSEDGKLPPSGQKIRGVSEDLFSGADTLAPSVSKIRSASDDLFSEETDVIAPSVQKLRTISEDLFAPESPKSAEDAVVAKKVKAPVTKKTDILSDDFQGEDDIFSSPIKKDGDLDDIFGKIDRKLDFDVSKKAAASEKISTTVSTIEADKKKDVSENKPEKRKLSGNLFGDSRESDGEDIFKAPKGTSAKDQAMPPSTGDKPKPTTRKSQSKNLSAGYDNINDDLNFEIPKAKDEKKIDSLFTDPLGREDDLFSSQKPKAGGKKSSLPVSVDSPDLFPVQDTKETVVNLVKDGFKPDSEEGVKKTTVSGVVDDKKPHVQPPVLAANSRKSPPRTLNLGKVIPSPKLSHNLPNLDDDFFGPHDADEDRIVQAWMKGHPPPLRDSKVENTMEEDPNYRDVYASVKTDVYVDNNSFFGDIPSSTLLHSHGKERARIQNRRRPPSRKIRKAPTYVPNVDQPVEERQVTITEPTSIETPASKGSVEEDRGSQETVEEWSTPEAALTSPPSVPPRSNPLSPSTDEEQDFFDVLPVGRYPPPMGPPDLSPFSDALNPNIRDGVGDSLWDKEENGLFEDAGDIMGQKGYDTLWAASPPPVGSAGVRSSFRDDGIPRDDLFSDVSKGKGRKSSLSKPPVETIVAAGKTDDDDLFASVGGHANDSITIKGKGTTSRKAEGSVKKEEKVGKKEGKPALSKKGDMDDLWGEGFTSGSKLKDDLFSKGGESSGAGDINDLFQGQGDLFSSSKTSSVQASGKVTVGIAGSKNIGKSLAKLPPKTKDSLFDDDEDDTEDLFSPRPSKPAPSKASGATRKVSIGKSVHEQKPKHTSVTVTTSKASSNDDSLFEDPLMVLKRKD